MSRNRRITTILTSFIFSIMILGIILFLGPRTADAGIYDAQNQTVYAEYWVVHANNYSGGCTDNKSWYIEPSYNQCDKTLSFEMPDISGASKVEIYIDLWRNRDIPSAVFSINGNANHQTTVGTDWGRTPYVVTIPKSEFQVGSNEITFKDLGGGEYHVHDVAFRVYENSSSAPTGSLTGITADNGSFDPYTVPTNPLSNTLLVDSDTLLLSATVTSGNADYVEFHAYYDGYDEDNDGDFSDWHNRGNTLLHPGGTEESALGGTIDHVATVPVNGAGVYTATWDLPYIVAQENVRFKVRLVNRDANDPINYVRDAAGGQSAEFTLVRSKPVVYFINPDFEDLVLHHDGDYPDTASVPIELPPQEVLDDFDTAYLIGSYWRNPYIRINGQNPRYNAFPGSPAAGEWYLSILEIDINDLTGGTNSIDYEHRNSFGEFIEKPGPMIVLKRTTPVNPTDNVNPHIYNESPEDGAILVDVDTPVSAAVFDAGSIDIDNDISMSIKIGAGTYQQVTPNITGNDFNAYLTYNHPTDYPYDTEIAVRIEAADRSGNMATSDFSFTTSPELGLSDLESDDFNACTFNDTRWTFVDPLGGNGPVGMTSEQALISVKEGQIHDLYGNTKDAPRIMQNSNNQNFDIEVKFDSIPDSIIEGQGLIIEEDANDYLRFNYHFDNTDKIRLFAYKTVAGSTSQIGTQAAITPVPGGSLYLRVVRTGFQTWTFAYSTGSGWHVPNGLQDFTHNMSVSKVGVFAINFGDPEASAPAYVANVDYFWNRGQTDPFESPYPGGEDSQALVIDVAYEGDGTGTVNKNVECGEMLIATAVPDPGSSFDHWSGVNAINGSTDATTPAFSFAKGDVLVAHFTRDQYELNIDVVSVDHEGNATSSTAGGTVTTSKAFPYYYNDEVTLTANPAPGWTFTGWQGAGLSGKQLSKTITMQQSENVTATFTQDKYIITVTQPAHGEIVVGMPVDGRQYVLYGEQVTLEANQTEADWQFSGWGGDLSGNQANPIVVTITGDLNVTAVFTDRFYIYLPIMVKP